MDASSDTEPLPAFWSSASVQYISALFPDLLQARLAQNVYNYLPAINSSAALKVLTFYHRHTDARQYYFCLFPKAIKEAPSA